MENYKELLEEQQKYIKKLLKESEKNLSKYKGPDNQRVRVSTSNGCSQYYIIDNETGKKKYVKKDKNKLCKSIIQHDYDLAINKRLGDMYKTLDKFIDKYDFDSIKSYYDDLPKARREMVTPIIESDTQFIERWQYDNPGNQNTFYGEGQYQTNRGEFVRSKSEKIIADALDKYGVPYQYEPLLPLLYLNGFHEVYPDFIVLNVRTRKVFYWEHLGLISEIEYAEKNFNKIQQYENSELLLGRDLIVTMESAENPLKIQIVEDKIREFLL